MKIRYRSEINYGKFFLILMPAWYVMSLGGCIAALTRTDISVMVRAAILVGCILSSVAVTWISRKYRKIEKEQQQEYRNICQYGKMAEGTVLKAEIRTEDFGSSDPDKWLDEYYAEILYYNQFTGREEIFRTPELTRCPKKGTKCSVYYLADGRCFAKW